MAANPCDRCHAARFCRRRCFAYKDWQKHRQREQKAERIEQIEPQIEQKPGKNDIKTEVEHNMNTKNGATCNRCGAPIVWLKTPKGKWMPADEGLIPYKANPEGKALLFSDRGESIKCDLYPDDKVPAGEFPTGLARRSHWATCPEADKFRQKKGAPKL